MKRLLTIIALAIPMTMSTVKAQNASPAVEKEIRAAIDAYFAAASRNDEAAMRRIEADEWFFSMDGTTMSKAERDADSAKDKKNNVKLPPRKYDVAIKRVISLGNDQYLVAGTNTITFMDAKAPKMPPAAFTEIWAKRGGQWRLLYSHYSTTQ